MYLLDSDHLSILQRQRGPEFEALSKRCMGMKAEDFFVTIISFHEQFNGWIKYIALARDSASLVRGYTELEKVVDNFSGPSGITCDSPGLADTGEMHLLDRSRLLFPCNAAWQRKTECLQTPIIRASIAPPITRRSVVFDAFRGL